MSFMPRWTASFGLAGLLLSLSLSAPAPVVAQAVQQSPAASAEDLAPKVAEIRKRLASLSRYSVFDWITFGFKGNGSTVVLNGFASRPVLKDDAAGAMKGIPGITSVDNQIKVLPLSPNDDRIRVAVYNRIYTQPALRKYNANQGSLGQALGPGNRSPAAFAGGITNNPPLGFHAIHIIVNNGKVALYGLVNNKSDSDIAYMQANSAPGAFGVENDLQIEGQAPQQKEK
jgi:hyperosmotically inducible periplasmic protein